ncbi:hypothetical protein OROMI_006768 [Orobanche minor]
MINPAQSGFIKGRNITDNILTAHEVTHDSSQSITNTIIKLDMEKAYDRINWNFIIQVMTRFGFSIVWINFIKTCISNCWFSILVNGQSAGFFRSKRGLRQGDPLSPLLFVVAVDYFSRCLDRLFNNNPSMFYKLKKKVKITHLAYADDILIFTNVSTKNLHILKNCFSHFERVSGQKINGNKSPFILYKPTAQLVEWVKSILVFNKADLPINYLGVPLWKGFQSFKMYDSLISKIQKKILTWNHHMLSTGGRLKLINSVLNSIALYNLQVIKPPDNVTTYIERLFNKFLWGTNNNKRKMHWASWNRLCFPKDEGGLGCRDLNDIIRAAHVKLWWRFRTSSNIWSNFMYQKYCSRLHPMLIKLNPKSSHIWKNMCDIRHIANKNIFWSSSNGKGSFWHDIWCEFGPLADYYPNNSKDRIDFYWNNGSWDREKIIRKLPSGVCDHICSYPCGPLFNSPLWTRSSNGEFSFKSAWELVRKRKTCNKILTSCWNPLITPTISFFLVRMVFNWIPTPDGLLRRGIIANNLCYCCDGDESMPHLFIHGPVAKERVDNVPFTPKRVCERIWSYIHNIKGELSRKRLFWKGAHVMAAMVGMLPCPRPTYTLIPVRWLKPARGWWKLNSDGAAKGIAGVAAAGGIVRDHNGNPYIMFSEFLGERTNNYSEVYAIWRGLELCFGHHTKVWVETDSSIAINLIKKKNTSHWQLQGLLCKIWDLMEKMEVHITHIFREGNVIVDWLANEGCIRRVSFCTMSLIFRIEFGVVLSVC